MKRAKDLNLYAKLLLLFMALLLLLFTVLYPVITSRVGFLYQDTIFVPKEFSDRTVYSGKLNGKAAQFTVSEDRTVVFQYGDTIYGPYTAREDASAIPQADPNSAEYMTGIELFQGAELFFRGGVFKTNDTYWLFSEDGQLDSLTFTNPDSDGIERDTSGNIIDSIAPSAATIWELMDGPFLTHRGQWLGWLMGVLLCLVNGYCILYADELFRWQLSWEIRDPAPDLAEPSDWQIMTRYISWTILLIWAIVLFIIGLQ